MIKVDVNEVITSCDSCGLWDWDIKNIRVSNPNRWWLGGNMIRLCDKCIAELLDTVKEEGGSVG